MKLIKAQFFSNFKKSARGLLWDSPSRPKSYSRETFVNIFCSYCGNHLGQAKLKNIGGDDFFFCNDKEKIAFQIQKEP